MAKLQKLLIGEREMDQGDDMISKLPDYLLHHILSFLTIKCVARTSILSKRWRYIWTSIPNLDFLNWRSPTTKDIHLETKRFMNFIDRMLLLRGMFNIQKFALKCDELCDASRINAWISTVIRCKVEELFLIVKVNEPFCIPLSLFTCESLIDLRLQTHSVLYLPQSISFPRLKAFIFQFMKFCNDYLFEQLVSSCPVLRTLILRSCSWLNMKVVCIRAPALKNLWIDDPDTVNPDGLHNCVVKVHAPNLVSLTYKGSVAKEYVLSSFSSLIVAKIDFVVGKTHRETRQEEITYGARVTKLLGGLSHVKRLTVSGGTLEALSLSADHLNNLPTFHNLIHLYVISAVEFQSDNALFVLLQMAPNLESLVFNQGFCAWPYVDDDVWKLNMANECLFLHLKSVHFKEFTGQSREMNLAELILKNARVLQKMTVTPNSFLAEHLQTKVVVMERLLRLPRESRSCVIEFSKSLNSAYST